MTIGQRIQKVLDSQGMTQKELAEKLGVSRQSVSLWETRKSKPSLEIITLLANLFNVSTDELLGNDMKVKTEENIDLQKANIKTKSKKVKFSICVIGVIITVLFVCRFHQIIILKKTVRV